MSSTLTALSPIATACPNCNIHFSPDSINTHETNCTIQQTAAQTNSPQQIAAEHIVCLVDASDEKQSGVESSPSNSPPSAAFSHSASASASAACRTKSLRKRQLSDNSKEGNNNNPTNRRTLTNLNTDNTDQKQQISPHNQQPTPTPVTPAFAPNKALLPPLQQQQSSYALLHTTNSPIPSMSSPLLTPSPHLRSLLHPSLTIEIPLGSPPLFYQATRSKRPVYPQTSPLVLGMTDMISPPSQSLYTNTPTSEIANRTNSAGLYSQGSMTSLPTLCNVKRFKVLQYNVWFDEYQVSTRMRAIGQIIQEQDPDIIMLQEVTENIFNIIANQSWFTAYYCSSAPPFMTYFTLLLTKWKPNTVRRRQYKHSQMGRDLLFFDVSLPIDDQQSHHLLLATSHLESCWQNGSIRRQQLEQALNYLEMQAIKCCADIIFAGDFNLNSDRECKDVFDSHQFKDAWTSLRGTEPGYTLDTNLNSMLQDQHHTTLANDATHAEQETKAANCKKRHYRARLDRCTVKLNKFKLKHIEMLGQDRIWRDEENEQDVYPSDHFGLCTTFAQIKLDPIENT